MMRTQPPVYSPLPLSALRAAYRMGDEAIPRLRALLEREYEAEQVLLTGSGTQALTLAIRVALDATGGDTVALPAYACYDVASAAVGAKARITFFDLDPLTLAPEAASLKAALRAGASVAVIAPLYGIPVPWDELETIARGHGALLIEDAAQGHGASWSGRPLGSIGALSVLSFGRGKGWTGGGGGALLVRGDLGAVLSSALPEQSAARAAHAVKALAQSVLARPRLYALPRALPFLGLGETVYRAPVPPHAMPAHAAALALATYEASREEAQRRIERARGLRQMLPPALTAIEAQTGVTGYLRFPVLVPRGRGELVRRLGACGAAVSYPQPLYVLSPVRGLIHESTQPGAERLVGELITLPVHSHVLEREARALVATVMGIIEGSAS